MVEANKFYKDPHMDKKLIVQWKLVITDIKLTCSRTYDAIMSGVREHIKRVEHQCRK